MTPQPPLHMYPLIKTHLAASILTLCLFQLPCSAGNWAHWRGPTGNGASPDARPPIEWSDTRNVKWKVAIPGRGSGSPVIWGHRVFVVTAVPAGEDSSSSPRALEFKLLCYDRKTGKLLWERTAATTKPHQGTHQTNGHASGSPCTDGEQVYAYFGSRGLFCYTMDGELKWKREDFGRMNTRNDFGEGSSPTLAGDKILVPWDHEGQSYLHAIATATGKTLWRTERDEPSCWATPLVVDYKGKSQVVMNGQTCARSYDLGTGAELWRCAGQTQRPVASPVAEGDLVIVGSGFQGSFMGAFRLDSKGNIENTDKVAWTLNRDTPDIASPLLSSGRVYYHKGKSGILSCVDAATGGILFSNERVPGISSVYASPIAAGGHVYLTGRSGTTVVLKDSGKFQIVASNSVGETVDATPAPVDGELFIRGEAHLFCIAE